MEDNSSVKLIARLGTVLAGSVSKRGEETKVSCVSWQCFLHSIDNSIDSALSHLEVSQQYAGFHCDQLSLRLAALPGTPRPASAMLEFAALKSPTSTGSRRLDRAMGGGVFAGEVTEIFGESSSGKTQLVSTLLGKFSTASRCVSFCLDPGTTSHRLHEVVAEDMSGSHEHMVSIDELRAGFYAKCGDELLDRVGRMGKRRDIEDAQFECQQRLEIHQAKLSRLQSKLQQASAAQEQDSAKLRSLRSDERNTQRDIQSQVRKLQYLARRAPAVSKQEVDALQWTLDRMDAGLSDPLDPVQWETDRRLSNVSLVAARGLRSLVHALETLCTAIDEDVQALDTVVVAATQPAKVATTVHRMADVPSASSPGAQHPDVPPAGQTEIVAAGSTWPWQRTMRASTAFSKGTSGQHQERLFKWNPLLPSPRDFSGQRWSDVGLIAIDGIASMVAEDLAAAIRCNASAAAPSAKAASQVRTREAFGLLARASSVLRRLAHSYGIAVVVTNSAVRMRGSQHCIGVDMRSMQPALGAAWAHGIDTSIELAVDNSAVELDAQRRISVASTAPSLSLLTGEAAEAGRSADKTVLAGAEDEVLQGAAMAASRRHGEGTGKAVLVKKLMSRPRLAIVRASPRLPPPIEPHFGSGMSEGQLDVQAELELALPPMTIAEDHSEFGAAMATLPSQVGTSQVENLFDGDRPCLRMHISSAGLVDEDYERTSESTGHALMADEPELGVAVCPDWLGLLPGAAATAAAAIASSAQIDFDQNLD